MEAATPLNQVRKSAKLSMADFAKLLGLNYRTAQSYCYGTNPLPHHGKGKGKYPNPSVFEVLEYRYGVDLQSLYSPKATSITGRDIDKDFCAKWKEHCGMSRKEIGLATKQLAGMIEAILLCSSGVAPHMTDDADAQKRRSPDKARVFVQKLRTVLENALKDPFLRKQVGECFHTPEFGEHKLLPQYRCRADLLGKNDNLLPNNEEWKLWVRKYIRTNFPIEVTLFIRPTFGLPNHLLKPYLLKPLEVPKEVERNWKKYGFGTSCVTLMTYKVESIGKRPAYFTVENSEADISGVYFSESQFQTGESTPVKLLEKPTKAPSKKKKTPHKPARFKRVGAKRRQVA